MAAILKKRALAEFVTTKLEDEPPCKIPTVQLKVSTEEKDTSHVFPFEKKSSPREALNGLLFVSEEDILEEENSSLLIERLSSFLQQENEAIVQVRALALMKEAVQRWPTDTQSILLSLMDLLKKERSHKVKAQLLWCLMELSKTLAEDSKLYAQLMSTALEHLRENGHLIKQRAFQLVSVLLPLSYPPDQKEGLLSLITSYTKSEDPRVRAAAYEALFLLHERGHKLQVVAYDGICEALRDEYESVRQAALQLVWVMASTYPEHVIHIDANVQGIRLVDDAFSKLCQSINDISVNVRVFAATLLGRFTCVSPHFLEQTLDKKIMSDMKRKRSAHERQWKIVTSGQWSSGTKWGDDKPQEVIDTTTVSFIHSGACGAFVHGLEDEFLEVRSATIDSMCQLGILSPQFANLSLDFLVDMFNDEIEDVRLKAIKSIGQLSKLIVLREDQVETMLSVLEDSNVEIREGLHDTLGSCKLSTTACLQVCVENLLEDLKRYPQDKESVWRCLQRLGLSHPELTQALAPELLVVHPYYDISEPDVEDPMYVSILILVFNASKARSTLTALFEAHTRKHYSYLRDTMPHLVPCIPLLENASPILQPNLPNTKTVVNSILLQLMTSTRSSIELWETARRDLASLSAMDSSIAHAADFISTRLDCHVHLAKAVANHSWLNPSGLGAHQASTLRSHLERLNQQGLRLQYLFSGLKPAEIAAVQATRLLALSLQLVYIVKASNTSALGLCEHLTKCLYAHKKFIEEHKVPAEPFVNSVVNELRQVEDPKPGMLARILLPILKTEVNKVAVVMPENVQKIRVEILEPTGESDSPKKFLGGMLLGIPVHCRIFHMGKPDFLRIRLKYPDQTSHFTNIANTDIRRSVGLDGEEFWRLQTTVMVSHQVWSESCQIELSLVFDVADAEQGNHGCRKLRGYSDYVHIIELCKPVRVLVLPKGIKKGI